MIEKTIFIISALLSTDIHAQQAMEPTFKEHVWINHGISLPAVMECNVYGADAKIFPLNCFIVQSGIRVAINLVGPLYNDFKAFLQVTPVTDGWQKWAPGSPQFLPNGRNPKYVLRRGSEYTGYFCATYEGAESDRPSNAWQSQCYVLGTSLSPNTSYVVVADFVDAGVRNSIFSDIQRQDLFRFLNSVAFAIDRLH